MSQQQVSGPAPVSSPDAPPGPPAGTSPEVSAERFRAAMARLAGGVVLITAFDPEEGLAGEDVGMTATAFVSVSLDPPLVLLSVRTGSRMDELLGRQPRWAASVLSESQRAVAGRFAMRGRVSDRLLFQDVPHTRGEASGALLVRGALATVECDTEQRVPAGDHTLVVGRVLAVQVHSAEAAPLVYFRGAYRRLG